MCLRRLTESLESKIRSSFCAWLLNVWRLRSGMWLNCRACAGALSRTCTARECHIARLPTRPGLAGGASIRYGTKDPPLKGLSSAAAWLYV